eukprot:Hpha_TRINITY_DN22051_c0_g1::TRINITY_DN22051_c0_g1_i1::g.112100::m.112100
MSLTSPDGRECSRWPPPDYPSPMAAPASPLQPHQAPAPTDGASGLPRMETPPTTRIMLQIDPFEESGMLSPQGPSPQNRSRLSRMTMHSIEGRRRQVSALAEIAMRRSQSPRSERRERSRYSGTSFDARSPEKGRSFLLSGTNNPASPENSPEHLLSRPSWRALTSTKVSCQQTDPEDSFCSSEGNDIFKESGDNAQDSNMPDEVMDASGQFWFRTRKELGRGANGIVWLGLGGMGGLAALKTVKHRGSTAAGIQELQMEVALLEQLRHDNIVRVLGHADIGEQMVLAMEYISGGSLDELLDIAVDSRLPFGNVAHYNADIVEGLLYLHRNRVTHGDLKPGNILLTIEGRCKLADFGAAAQLTARFGGYVGTNEQVEQRLQAGQESLNRVGLESGLQSGSAAARRHWRIAGDAVQSKLRMESLMSQTQSASGHPDSRKLEPLVGTPAYIAPEACLRQSKPISDMWSLGITLFQLLVGRFPYRQEDHQALFGCWRLGHDPTFGPTIGPDDFKPRGVGDYSNVDSCKDFVLKCLEKDHRRRLTSAAAHTHSFVVASARPMIDSS